MNAHVFKILHPEAWTEARAGGAIPLSPADAADGFVHLSTHAQLDGTLRAHYAEALDLVRVGFREEDLGAALKWEPSRNGDLFPHFYGMLEAAWARDVVRLHRTQPGQPFTTSSWAR